jgi:hypothetical protein
MTHTHGDQELYELRLEFPEWDIRHGISALWVGILRGSVNPPVIIRGESLQDLRDELTRDFAKRERGGMPGSVNSST